MIHPPNFVLVQHHTSLEGVQVALLVTLQLHGVDAVVLHNRVGQDGPFC